MCFFNRRTSILVLKNFLKTTGVPVYKRFRVCVIRGQVVHQLLYTTLPVVIPFVACDAFVN